MPDGSNKPVSYQEVADVVVAALEEGKPKAEITSRFIREKVGERGSFVTLLKHRNRFFNELGEPKREDFITDDDLAAVRSTVNDVVARQIDADRAKANLEREADQAEIRALKARIMDLEDVAAENEDRFQKAQEKADAAQLEQSELKERVAAAEAALKEARKEARKARKTLANVVKRLVKPSQNDHAADPSGPCDGQHRGTDAAEDWPAADPNSANNGTRSGDNVEETAKDFDDEAIFPMDNVAFDHAALERGKGTEPD